METAKRSTHTKGFVVMPRRLAMDFENLAGALVPFVTLAFNQLALRRLALA